MAVKNKTFYGKIISVFIIIVSICIYNMLPLSICPWAYYFNSKYYLTKEFSEYKDEEGVPHYYVCEDGKDQLRGVFDGVVKRIGRSRNLLYADVKQYKGADKNISMCYALNLGTGEIFSTDSGKVSMVSPKEFFDNNKNDGIWISLYWGIVLSVLCLQNKTFFQRHETLR